MKEVILHHLKNSESLLYKTLNALVVGVILYSFATIVQIYSKETKDYFVYNTITPTSNVFAVSGELTFMSDIERFQETNMRYNDTLFCGFGTGNMFWYSQFRSEYNDAPKGNFISMWRYEGEVPTVPMVCRLSSSPYASLAFGKNTKPQTINTSFFYFK